MKVRPDVASRFLLRASCFSTVALLFASLVPCLFAQDDKGCQGVEFAKKPLSLYSPNALRTRLEQNPADVDALIHLGLHLEEQDQFTQAYALYERAIRARPDCHLGYYFAGLVGDRIAGGAAFDAEVKIRRAISLSPGLATDPNVQSFLKRHSQLAARPPSKEAPSVTDMLLASANRFLVGVGVGLLLAAPLVYVAGRKRMIAG